VASRSLDKDRRLRRRAEFQKVFDTGQRFRGTFFTILIAPGSDAMRLGIVASRKVGDAVRRNRAKRLIRELFRLYPQPLDTAADVVVIPKTELFAASYVNLQEDFRQVLHRGLTRLKRTS
jgi:ribonuclease P protein component